MLVAARLRAAVVLAVAVAVITATVVLAPAATGRPITPLDETTSTTCVGSTTTSSTTTSSTTTSTTEPTTTTSTTEPTTTTSSTSIPPSSTTFTLPPTSTTFDFFAHAEAVPCETTTTRRATTTTTEATTTTTADVSSEDPGSIEIPADQSRATVRPGGDVEVSTNVTDVGDDETPIEEGTTLEAQVKVAEGDTTPLFSVEAEVQRDGSVSFDVTFPEDTEPGVYLVVVVLPGLKDANGNVLRRPRVAIATVVVRGRAGRALPRSSERDKRADATSIRFGGADRYETARAVATGAFDDVLAPILATGETYPDALAASYIAGAIRTPILLTPKDHLDLTVLSALTALGATGVEIIGGPGAISEHVVDQLEDAGYATTRVGGVDRYDTARQIGTMIPPEGVGQLEDKGLTAIVVSGTSFADALTASPMSYSQGWPIFLTGADSLHAQTRSGLEAMGIEHVLVVGGTDAVGSGVTDDLAAMGITIERIAGVDRVDTSLAVANFLFDRLDYDANDLALARGDDFPDALAAGPRGGDEVLPILLTPSATELGDAARTFIRAHRGVIEDVEAVGGTAAVSDLVLENALMLAGVIR